MARAVRKKELTAEERLAAALVPEEEQPYKVPGNWCWTMVGCVADVVTGGTPSKKHEEYYGGQFPFFKPSDLDAGRNVHEASEYLSDEGKKVARIIPAKSSAVCCIGTIGKCGYLLREGTTNQQINSAIPKFNPLYLFYYFQTEQFVNELWSKAAATTISIVNKSKMESCCFPLAPKAEQQRIVTLIESLFADLDEAKEKLTAVVEGFAQRKAAILHQAFTGELTAKWREENDISFTATWKDKTIVDLCSLIVDCPHSTPQWKESGKVCLRTTNIKDGYLDLEEIRYVSEETYNERVQRAIPQPGDVLLTREGSIGDVGVIPSGIEICLGQRMMLLRPKECKSNFLVYFFRNPTILSEIKAKTMGSTAPRMNMKDLKKLTLQCPSYDEQCEIVRILDDLFEQEQQAQSAVETVLADIDTLKKSILARAFRGELSTNDPKEENAVGMLKKVLCDLGGEN